MRILIAFLILILPSAYALERAPSFAETHCAYALATMTSLPLIQPSDLHGKIDTWPLSDDLKNEIKKDLYRHSVDLRVASLRGESLEKFARTFLPGLDRLDEAVAAERRRVATQLTSPRRLVAASVAVVVASLSTLAMVGDQSWALALAGNGGLVATGALVWRAYFNSSYSGVTEGVLQALKNLNTRMMLHDLSIPDGVPELKSTRDAQNMHAWLRRDFVRELSRTHRARASADGIEASIEYNRRWGWLDVLLPGRQRVNVTYFFSRDEQGDKRLTIVTRVKPR